MSFTLDAIKDEAFKDLLFKLLSENPMTRIGANDLNELKNHSFFKDVKWHNLSTPNRIKNLKKRIRKIIDELFVSSDIEEATCCISEMDEAFYGHQVVKFLISSAFDHGNRERELASQFLVRAVGDNTKKYPIPRKNAELGFVYLLESVDELHKDVPNILEILSSFIARGIVDEVLPPSFLHKVDCSDDDNMRCSVINHAKYLLSGPQCKVNDALGNIWKASVFESVASIKRAIGGIIREYLVSRELSEALMCIQELDVPMFHHEIVKQLVLSAADYYDVYHDNHFDDDQIKHSLHNIVQIRLAIDLISTALQHNIMAVQQIKIGFERLTERLDDYKLDCPLIHKYYRCILAPFQEKIY